MRTQGLSGARRGKAFTITTRHAGRRQRPADLIKRKFRAPAPNQLWVADLTYVKTHSGWVNVAFFIDIYSRKIVGWQASRSLRSGLAIDALEMAVFNRQRAGHDLNRLVNYSDRGVQYLSVRYPNASPKTTSSRRSDRSAIVTTTPWLSRSTGYKSGNPSTRKAYGVALTMSSSRR
jgi:transposase InsO family protein